ETHDGHAFVGAALTGGAAAALVDADPGPIGAGASLVRVADTGRALLDLAAARRGELDARVVGVTGANGKTSTKDFVTAVLATRLRIHASPRSFNTEVGVPLTVLDAPDDTQALVLELGARRRGDVRLLCEIARPDVVIVTNVGVAHMEIFGSWEAIVEASAEPIEALGEAATAILAADDRVVRGFERRTRARVLTFGRAPGADVRAVDVELDRLGRASFTVEAGSDRGRTRLAVPGEHMVQNALAAIAAGRALGIPLADALVALEHAHVSAWRMETFETRDGVVVVNDAYNANPESMAAGLKAARWIAREKRLIAVLGHMAELGPISLEEHERLGDLATRLRVDVLIAVGDGARPIAIAAVREGLEPGDVHVVGSPEEAATLLSGILQPGDVVFLKGSRVAGLERLATALREGVPA
ncbi:MAG: UDP-N-acetylmuramoyl-tripeptide--D-alanyl-D-alanine ligase, partial [Actinomycetota bacterium]